MPEIPASRATARIDGDFVVFLIGNLERYARARDREHWPAWVEFNRRMKNARGDVGIWHETYLVRAGGRIRDGYSGMPLMGLAKASLRAEVTAETDSARGRLGGGEGR